MAAAIHYSIYLSCFSVVATAMLPVRSIPLIKRVDEASCYFFSFFCHQMSDSVFSVRIRGGSHICSVGLKNSLWYLECVQLVFQEILYIKDTKFVRVANTTWTSCVWGFRGDNQWGIISFTSALTHSSEAEMRHRSVEMGKINPDQGRPSLRPFSAQHYFSVLCQTVVTLLA